jgi:hypothetical protein
MDFELLQQLFATAANSLDMAQLAPVFGAHVS